MIINPKEIPTGKLFSYLTSSVTPRPIALVSSVDEFGNSNLSPFSFFNVFSANPPILIFSPSRRVRDNTTKDTLENVKIVPEVVISLVDNHIVQQMSLSSTEFDKGINEFTKSGLTPEPSSLVKPPMIKESPINFECKVNEVKALGTEGGAGNLVICEILKIHIDDQILDKNGQIDPRRWTAVSRLGGNWYGEVNSNSIFEVQKPTRNIGIGVDSLPSFIKQNKYLSGNDLGILGGLTTLPSEEEVNTFKKISKIDFNNHVKLSKQIHSLLNIGMAWEAILILYANET